MGCEGITERKQRKRTPRRKVNSKFLAFLSDSRIVTNLIGDENCKIQKGIIDRSFTITFRSLLAKTLLQFRSNYIDPETFMNLSTRGYLDNWSHIPMETISQAINRSISEHSTIVLFSYHSSLLFQSYHTYYRSAFF